METFRQSGQKVHIGISDIQGLKAFELMEKLRKTFGQTTNKDNLCRGIGSGDHLDDFWPHKLQVSDDFCIPKPSNSEVN